MDIMRGDIWGMMEFNVRQHNSHITRWPFMANCLTDSPVMSTSLDYLMNLNSDEREFNRF